MKVKSYPFVPKSTAPLAEGMFWDMALTGGKHGVGVILQLDPRADKRRGRMFFGGVLDIVTSAVPTASDLASAKLVAQGFAHLKVITENGGMVRGMIDLQALRIQPQIMRDIGDSRHAKAVRGYHAASVERGRSIADYPVACTWGYAVPRRIADAIPRKKEPNQPPQTTRGKAPRV
jgi:hypothetical protein